MINLLYHRVHPKNLDAVLKSNSIKAHKDIIGNQICMTRNVIICLQNEVLTELNEALSAAETELKVLEHDIINSVREKLADIQTECEAWHDYVQRNRRLIIS